MQKRYFNFRRTASGGYTYKMESYLLAGVVEGQRS